MKVFCAVIVFVAAVCLPSFGDLADGISAVVNDQVITYQEVREFTAPALEVLQQEYAEQPAMYNQKVTDTLRDGLNTLIENKLILHEFATKYNPLPESVVDQWVSDRIRERFGDRITCIRTLQAEGETFEKFRQDIRDQNIIMELRYKNLSSDKIIISPYKIENYYLLHQADYRIGDQVKVRMIVLNKSAPDDKATRQKADEILADIRKGASFQQMQSLYSQDQEQRGSDWIQTSVLRPELADAIPKLKTGETSDVIETSDACYILRLDARRPAHVQPLNDVRGSIEATLRAQEQKTAETRWMASLKKKAFIRIF